MGIELDDEVTDPLVAPLTALAAGEILGLAFGRGEVITEANAELLRILGVDRDRLTEGVTWTEFTPADQLERDMGALQDVVRRGSALLVKDFQRPDGTRVSVVAAIAALSLHPYQWVAVVVDLSGHRRRLDRLSDTAIVSALLDEAPIGFALIDPELRFLRVNRELAAMNGYSVAQHEGRLVFELVPGAQEAAEPLLRQVLNTGKPVRDIEVTGWTAARPDRKGTWLESFFPVRVPDGPVLGIAVIARDVTEVLRLRDELRVTSQQQRSALLDLQTGLLPPVPEVEGVELCARYLSASSIVHLGGDWFDVIEVSDDRLVLCVGDVTGHGLGAVGAMARVSGAMRAYVYDGYGPGEVLTRTNHMLTSAASTSMATAAILCLDRVTGRLEYACAGHPAPVVHRPDTGLAELTSPGGLPLGACTDAAFTTGHATLPYDSYLVLYTDGLVERRGETLDEGTDRLHTALAGTPTDAGAADLVDHVLARCLADGRRRDDVCLLVLRRLTAR